MDQSLSLPFDQYQRYKIVSDIINKFRTRERKFKILDIGAGFEEILEKFLPRDNIYCLDKEYSPENTQNEKFIAGDIFDIKFKEKFDFIVAIDVYEHIPPSNRKAFLDIIIPLSEIATIIAAPFDQDGVKNYEFIVNELYKISHGSDYIWLKEHIENGLPSLSETQNLIKEYQFNYLLIPNGYLPRWFEMISTFLLTEGKPEFQKLWLSLNELYNNNYYQFDNRNPAYRQVIVILKEDKKIDISDLVDIPINPDKDINVPTFLVSFIEKINHHYLINNLLYNKNTAEENIKLLKERDSLNSALTDKDIEIRQLIRNVSYLENEIGLLKSSISYTILHKFHTTIIETFFPSRTNRRKLYDLGLKGGRIAVNEGIGKAFTEFKKRRIFIKTRKNGSKAKPILPRASVYNIPETYPVTSSYHQTCTTSTEYVPLSEIPVHLTENDIKFIAFYLPQFHPIPENDLWWGKGFTEWTNVTRAFPQFEGHYQPHFPGELGYYDLRLVDIQKRQIELAKHYGIYGFCFYYYFFNGKRLLERPLNQFLDNKELDFPFCICWANENWTRSWDGLENEILISQQHSPESDIEFIKDLEPLLKDPRYIRIAGKPLVIVYRATLLPDCYKTTQRWREYCRTSGIGEIYLVTALCFGCDNPYEYGFDAAVEFPPHTMHHRKEITKNVKITNPNFSGRIYDFAEFVRSKQYLQHVNFKLFKTASPGWDNTPRRLNNASIWHGATPELYKKWLLDITIHTKDTLPPEEHFVFINAWNEWAEGAHLEPDRKFGYGYLQSTADVITEVRRVGPDQKKIIIVTHDAHFHGAQLLALNLTQVLKERFHYNVHTLIKVGGVLEKEFERYSTVHVLDRDYPDRKSQEKLVADLSVHGFNIAIGNTVVSGDIVEVLSKNNIRTISLIHELPGVIKQYEQQENLNKIFSYAHKIIFPSKFVKDAVLKNAEIRVDACLIAPQGLYEKNKYKDNISKARVLLRKTLSLPENAKIVLGVGFADQRKGADIFARVARDVVKSIDDCYFIWAGHEHQSFIPSVHKFIREEKIGNRIRFVGKQEDISLFYAGADLYLLTSREDPFPSVVLEALDVSVPVIGFEDAGGFGDILIKGGGMLVPYMDTTAMTDNVKLLLKDENLRAEMGKRGRDIIETDYRFIDYVYYLLEILGHSYKKVSVIIPNYNYGHYLAKRLESIVHQQYPIYEIVFLDDYSKDNSILIAEKFRESCPVDFTIIKNTNNSGSVFRQWAKGLEIAKGEYCWIAEADDLSDDMFLSKVMTGFTDSAVILSYCQSKQMDENGRIFANDYNQYTGDIDEEKWKSNYIVDGYEEIQNALAIKNTIPNVSAVVFKKVDITGILPELTSYKVAGDWFFYVWLLQKGKVAFFTEPLNYHRRHHKAVTQSEDAKNHFNEIVKMQEYILDNFTINKTTYAKIIHYRRQIKEYLLGKEENIK